MGIYPVPLPAGYFSAFSFCLDCYFGGGFSVFWQFVVLLYCEGSSLWVGLDEWLVKFSWSGKLVLVFWWVELDFFSVECNEVSISKFLDVYGFGVTLCSLYIEASCILKLRAIFLHCWRICVVYVLLWNLLALGWYLVSV